MRAQRLTWSGTGPRGAAGAGGGRPRARPLPLRLSDGFSNTFLIVHLYMHGTQQIQYSFCSLARRADQGRPPASEQSHSVSRERSSTRRREPLLSSTQLYSEVQ